MLSLLTCFICRGALLDIVSKQSHLPIIVIISVDSLAGKLVYTWAYTLWAYLHSK